MIIECSKCKKLIHRPKTNKGVKRVYCMKCYLNKTEARDNEIKTTTQ